MILHKLHSRIVAALTRPPTILYSADPAFAPERKGNAAAFDLKSTQTLTVRSQQNVSISLGNDGRYAPRANRIATIDTGVAFAIPKGYVGLVSLRSGMADEGVIMPNAPGIIDPDYRGTVKVKLISLFWDWAIEEGQRFAQITFVPAARVCEACEVLPATERGDRGFGSTGVK